MKGSIINVHPWNLLKVPYTITHLLLGSTAKTASVWLTIYVVSFVSAPVMPSNACVSIFSEYYSRKGHV